MYKKTFFRDPAISVTIQDLLRTRDQLHDVFSNNDDEIASVELPFGVSLSLTQDSRDKLEVLTDMPDTLGKIKSSLIRKADVQGKNLSLRYITNWNK